MYTFLTSLINFKLLPGMGIKNEIKDFKSILQKETVWNKFIYNKKKFKTSYLKIV